MNMSRFWLSLISKVIGSDELVKIVVSSAYITITHLHFTECGNELTKTMNKRGPNIDPWGIPMLISLKSERVEFIFTAWHLFLRYDSNHCNNIFCNNMFCFHNKTLLVMFYRHNKKFWYQFCNFKHFLKAENSEDSLASLCVEFSISMVCHVTQYETGLQLTVTQYDFETYFGLLLELWIIILLYSDASWRLHIGLLLNGGTRVHSLQWPFALE